ncbi:MAG: hypothetical protein JNL98_12705 [Bryobacterales bacterium]|nr:hypothetical protein [Bryobacterales bacterium]
MRSSRLLAAATACLCTAVICSALIFTALICVAQDTETAKSDPMAYLQRALDLMQARALHKDRIDWSALRKEAIALAADAELTVDTYEAIRFALSRLNDNHSSFHPTPSLRELESQRHATKPGPPAPTVPPSPFSVRFEPEGRLVRHRGMTFGVVIVPKCFPASDKQFIAYATRLQQVLASLGKSKPAGWVVDLRGNVGGNMWPMLTGIGPLLGEGDHLGEFFSTHGHSVWKYRDGVAAEVENGIENAYPAVAGLPHKISGNPKVAVLIDRRTGSSGEAIGIAFRGRTETRFFGERTAGLSTVNSVIRLSDGASLWLTVGVQADRTGKQYPSGFEPDESVEPPSTLPADEDDPVLQAALRWLSFR